MSGRGSGGNVLAALCSFFMPGLGQLVQGRFWPAFGFFFLSIMLWLVLLGWIVHVVACVEAAKWQPTRS